VNYQTVNLSKKILKTFSSYSCSELKILILAVNCLSCDLVFQNWHTVRFGRYLHCVKV